MTKIKKYISKITQPRLYKLDNVEKYTFLKFFIANTFFYLYFNNFSTMKILKPTVFFALNKRYAIF